MQADGGGSGYVQRLASAGLADAHRQRGSYQQRLTHALAFMPQDPGTWPWKDALLQQLPMVRTGDDQGYAQALDVGRGQTLHHVKRKMCSHAARNTLGDHKAALPVSDST